MYNEYTPLSPFTDPFSRQGKGWGRMGVWRWKHRTETCFCFFISLWLLVGKPFLTTAPLMFCFIQSCLLKIVHSSVSNLLLILGLEKKACRWELGWSNRAIFHNMTAAMNLWCRWSCCYSSYYIPTKLEWCNLVLSLSFFLLDIPTKKQKRLGE